MTELPLIFVGGFLGSSHCVGMCGPLAIALGMPSTSLVHNFRRQLAFSVGRLSTYGFAGAVAAFAGLWLRQWSWLAASVQAMLALLGGFTLVILGLTTAGVIPRLKLGWTVPQPCAAAGWLKTLLLSTSLSGAFLAGLFTGFIPCGLVYGFLAIAAASGNITHGWLIMTAFGLGTMPLMLLTGCGATVMSVATRSRVLRVAAWCVVVAGAISIARGTGQLSLSSGSTAAICPFCHDESLQH